MLCRCFDKLADKWEIAGEERDRYKFCSRCTCQKVYYCSKSCQKGIPSAFISSHQTAHWTGCGGLYHPAHKVVYGTEEQVIRAMTQEARSKSVDLKLGWPIRLLKWCKIGVPKFNGGDFLGGDWLVCVIIEFLDPNHPEGVNIPLYYFFLSIPNHVISPILLSPRLC